MGLSARVSGQGSALASLARRHSHAGSKYPFDVPTHEVHTTGALGRQETPHALFTLTYTCLNESVLECLSSGVSF